MGLSWPLGRTLSHQSSPTACTHKTPVYLHMNTGVHTWPCTICLSQAADRWFYMPLTVALDRTLESSQISPTWEPSWPCATWPGLTFIFCWWW
jgi:hypothetical protein